MATYAALKKQIRQLEEKAEKMRKSALASVIAGIRKTMAEYGLTVADLEAAGARKPAVRTSSKAPASGKAKDKPAPKYQDPVSGKTWSGFGRVPHWMTEAIAKGRRDDMLIRPSAPAPAVKPAVAAKKASATKPAGRKTTAKKPVGKKPSAPVRAKKVAKPSVATPEVASPATTS